MIRTQILAQSFFLVAILLSGPWAQSQAGTSASQLPAGPTDQNKRIFHMTAQLGVQSNLYSQNSIDRESSNNLLLMPSISLTELRKLSLQVEITQQTSQAKETSIGNTQLSLSQKIPMSSPGLSSSVSLKSIFPTDQVLQKETSYQGAIGMAGGFSFAKEMWLFKYDLALTRNIHQYTQSSEGSANIQYGVTNGLAVQVEPFRKWSLSLSALYRNAWTYKSYERNSFSTDLAAEYSLHQNWSVNVGTSNQGSALKANGIDSNMKFFDENTSVVYASVIYVN